MKARLARVRQCLLFGSLSACVSQNLKVHFSHQTLPNMNTNEQGSLGFALDPKLDESLKVEIQDAFKSCGLYTSMDLLSDPITIKGNNLREVFEAAALKRSIEKDFILNIQLEHSDVVEGSETVQVINFTDQASYDWFPSHGIPQLGTLSLAQQFELAPTVQTRRRTAKAKTYKINQVLRLSLYNRVLNKMVLDRISRNQIVLNNFSKKPSLEQKRLLDVYTKSQAMQLMRSICPDLRMIERTVYRSDSPSKIGSLINEGVDLAAIDNWNVASTKWLSVIKEQPRNVYAHHNLGVHLERQGDILEALEHYKVARRAKKIPDDVFADIFNESLPFRAQMRFYPQVSYITGGNWVLIHADNPVEFQRSSVSVYRVLPLLDTESLQTIGHTIREIGTVRYVSSDGQFVQARVREFLADTPIKPGDLVFLEEVVPTEAALEP